MIPQLPAQFVREMAQRRRRFHLYLWHRLRSSWPRLSGDERQAVCDINPAWGPLRPSLDAARRPARDNGSGEDFLFMNRQMIALADDLLGRAADPAYPRIEGWQQMPPPGDRDYPVPEFPDSELEEVKSPPYFEHFIARWERRYTDPAYLKGVTLGQLGSDIEFTICHDAHLRWAAPSPVGYRPSGPGAQEIGEEWDAPAYDYLGDTYSSHVNLLFWKIHGWVDERVNDWKRAHGISGGIEWRRTWVGPPASDEDEYRRIDAIISTSAAAGIDGFFRPIPRPRGPAR